MAEEIWSDIHQNIESGPTGGIRKVINTDAVKTSVDNILRTRYNSRVMLPEFGCVLNDLVFSSMSQDNAKSIIKDIKQSIERWDNRVSINAVNVYQSPDENYIKIEVSFSVRGYDDVMTISTIF